MTNKLRYAHKLTVGDKVCFVSPAPGIAAPSPLTVSSVKALSNGDIAVGYVERNGSGAVYRAKTIMTVDED